MSRLYAYWRNRLQMPGEKFGAVKMAILPRHYPLLPGGTSLSLPWSSSASSFSASASIRSSTCAQSSNRRNCCAGWRYTRKRKFAPDACPKAATRCCAKRFWRGNSSAAGRQPLPATKNAWLAWCWRSFWGLGSSFQTATGRPFASASRLALWNAGSRRFTRRTCAELGV